MSEQDWEWHDRTLDHREVKVSLEITYKFEEDFLEDYLIWLDGHRDDMDERIYYLKSMRPIVKPFY